MTTTILYPQGPIRKVDNLLKAIKITVATNGSGNASVESDPIYGEIYKLTYDRGTVDATTTAVTTITLAAETVDTKNVNSAAYAVTYPVVSGSVKFVVGGTLTITVASGAASKTFDVYVYYR